jgi:ribosome biogenesis GTPase / thiamine phosphate phosphatase
MHDLTTLGFGPHFADQLDDDKPWTVARIAAEHRGSFEVWSDQGDGTARLSGRLRRHLTPDEIPGVGDWVTLSAPPGPDRQVIAQRVLERRTVFLRGAAGRRNRGQVVAANVDIVFAVSGLDEDFNVRRIERYLTRIWASGAQPYVILNKADLADAPELKAGEVEARCPGVDVYLTSALHAEGLAKIRRLVGPGVTAAFVGSSGAGKSTLVNALLGEQRMATGAVRATDGRGCHVTSHRQIVLLESGGLLLDTPGMRELQLVDDEGLDTVFADVEAIAQGCRFGDCKHKSEPGCAVAEAIDSGALTEERFDHYRTLLLEADAFTARQNEHLRRQSDRALSQMYAQTARLRKRDREQ